MGANCWRWTGDFQDLRLWRRQVAEMLVGLVEEYRRPVLVPMTLVNPAYVAEVFGAIGAAGIPLHHFFLKVPEDVLTARIDARSFTPDDPERDARVRRWCKERVAACTAAVDTLPADTVFLDGETGPGELAEAVRRRVTAGGKVTA
ncbi:AAA family ATPase [Streptomyces phaeolivaceus]|uniref:AAA family ATPase n=1 Tax=Streptomyces phaeolivaceus TaxID=2653200 RepID=UPI001D040257|nr:TmrB-like protein [Streptomyces phaeolivaceus]